MGIDAREPEISVRARRILAALLISIGLHAALIGWLRFQMIPGSALAQAPISIRLVSVKRAVQDKVKTQTQTPAPASNSPESADNPAKKRDRMAIKVPVQIDDTYYPTRELDVPPHPSIEVNPVYPAQAVRDNLQGWVILKMKIDYLGRVQSIDVQSADPPEIFDESSLEAFRRVKFIPAQKDGHAVNSLIQIKVSYQMK